MLRVRRSYIIMVWSCILPYRVRGSQGDRVNMASLEDRDVPRTSNIKIPIATHRIHTDKAGE